MPLSYLTLFCPSLGTTEESVANQLLFYTDASGTSTLDQQLRNVGLVQGIIELGRSFAPETPDRASTTRPLRCIKSEKTTSVLTELEPGIWCCLCMDVQTPDDVSGKSSYESALLPHPLQIQCQLHEAHTLFCANHGTLTSLIQPDASADDAVVAEARKVAIKQLERYWLRWSWRWKAQPASVDCVYRHRAVRVSARTVSHKQQTEAHSILKKMKAASKDQMKGYMVFEDDDCLAMDETLAQPTRRVLQETTRDLLREREKRQSHVETSTSQANDPSAQENGRASWWTGKAWAEGTRSMMTALRSVSVGQSSQGDTENGEENQERGSWLDAEEARVIWLPGEHVSSCIWHRFRLMLWQRASISVAFLLDDETSAPLESLVASSEQLMDVASVLQARVVLRSTTHKATDEAVPAFFTISYHGVRGTLTSTLPEIEPLDEEIEETPQQTLVRRNALHLHESLYTLLASLSSDQPHASHQQLIRTARNIWIVYRREVVPAQEGQQAGVCEVVLCRSAQVGDTAEVIYGEACAQMKRLLSASC